MTDTAHQHHHINNNNNTSNNSDDNFTEMGSVSDLNLKSVSVTDVLSSELNSPVQSAESGHESSSSSNESATEKEEVRTHVNVNATSTTASTQTTWPRYKRFKNPVTGEEAIYELVDTTKKSSKGILTLCCDIITLSSISLFVASNLFVFTIGIIAGRRSAYDY